MGLLFFAFGSGVGAALAWFVGRREPSRSTVLAFNGIACGLLGVLASASKGTTTPAIEAGLGLLSTAAPLTLCMRPFRAVASRAGIACAVRHLAATLALALVYGITCATLGFVSVVSVRHVFGVRYISDKENVGKRVDYSIMMSLNPSHTPSAALPCL